MTERASFRSWVVGLMRHPGMSVAETRIPSRARRQTFTRCWRTVNINRKLAGRAATPRPLGCRPCLSCPVRASRSTTFSQAPDALPDVRYHPTRLFPSNVCPPSDKYTERQDKSDGQNCEVVQPRIKARQSSKAQCPLKIPRQKKNVFQSLKFDCHGFVGHVARIWSVYVQRTRPLSGDLQLKMGMYRHRGQRHLVRHRRGRRT